MKLDYKKTFLIGFGFFATSIAWSIYNSYVPLLLSKFITTSTLVGFIMTIDNIFGIIFQPLFGVLSDKTHTPIGRRMPYILIGIPICALLFALVPTMSFNILPLMITIIVFNMVMSTWRSPVVALMPDITPAPLRSKANGVINLMGGLGSLIAFAIGGMIFRSAGYNGPFILSGVVMIAATVVLALFVREPVLALNPEPETKVKEKKEKEKLNLSKGEKKSLILILLAIFFWFTGYNAIETFFTLYATNTVLSPGTTKFIDAGTATMLMAFFSVSFIAAALPAGILGGKIGRKKTILLGLLGITALFLPMYFIKDLWTLRIMLLFGGIFWAFVNINSLPMVVEMAGNSRNGTFTGYYYFFSFGAAIISPTLFGLIRDLTHNYSLIFIYATVSFIIAMACIIFVKHGESVPQKLTTEEVMAMQED
jgi:maltose/moltooligosaccharide transporter